MDVMLAKKYQHKNAKWPMWASPKLDGIRGFYCGSSTGFRSRNQKRLLGLDHLIQRLVGKTPFILDGELIVPGMHFQEMSGLIRNHKQQPTAEYHIFDVVCDLPFEDRLLVIADVVKKVNDPLIKLVQHNLVDCYEHALEMYTCNIEKGLEGLMLKSRGHRYRNARSWDWLKLKAEETADLMCVGFFEGEGRLLGTLGGIIVNFNGVEVRVGTGFSDIQRDEIWNNKRYYLKCCAEVAWHEETPGGSLRHPSFRRWRLDK